MKQKFDVTGMSCSACSAHVEKAVSRVPGSGSGAGQSAAEFHGGGI